MSSYPKWLYHATKEPALVDNVEAHEALGAGWYESPADVVYKAPPAKDVLEDAESLTDLVKPLYAKAVASKKVK